MSTIRDPQPQQRESVPAGYTPTDPETREGYAPIVDAWIRGDYPLRNDGRDGLITGQGSRHAVQLADGRGLYESAAGSRLFALRTADGTVVWNDHGQGGWPYGATTQDRVDEEVTISTRFLGAILTEQTDIDFHQRGALALGTDGTFVDGQLWLRGVVTVDILDEDAWAERGALLTHGSGMQVYVGWDSTAHEGDEQFGFVPFDGARGTPVPSARDALDLLRPAEAAGRPESEVVRQGEWFLVPASEPVSAPAIKPGVGERPYGPSPLESHVPREWTPAVPVATFLERAHESFPELPDDVRTAAGVFEWLHEQDADSDLFATARDLAGGIYVRGSFRHRRQEHFMETVDGWHRAVTHDREVITGDDRRIQID